MPSNTDCRRWKVAVVTRTRS